MSPLISIVREIELGCMHVISPYLNHSHILVIARQLMSKYILGSPVGKGNLGVGQKTTAAQAKFLTIYKNHHS